MLQYNSAPVPGDSPTDTLQSVAAPVPVLLIPTVNYSRSTNLTDTKQFTAAPVRSKDSTNYGAVLHYPSTSLTDTLQSTTVQVTTLLIHEWPSTALVPVQLTQSTTVPVLALLVRYCPLLP